MLGQAEGATGTIIFGADGANGAYGGFSTITGGAGGGTVVFNEALVWEAGGLLVQPEPGGEPEPGAEWHGHDDS